MHDDPPPLPPDEVEALEAARRAGGDVGDAIRADDPLMRALRDAEDAFDPARARTAIDERRNADRMLMRCGLAVGAGVVAIAVVRAAFGWADTPGWGSVWFIAVAAALGLLVRLKVMARRAHLAAMAERGPLELQHAFEATRRSSRNERTVMHAAFLICIPTMAVLCVHALVGGEWWRAILMAWATILLTFGWRVQRRGRTEAFFAGRLSAREWMSGKAPKGDQS